MRRAAALAGARRSPPAGWEAYLLIGIFPEGEPSWCKVTLFSGGRRPAWWCVSAVEGMQGAGLELVLLGFRDRIDRQAHELGPGELVRSGSGWRVHTPRIAWEGELPRLELASERLSLVSHTPHVVGWARLGNVLTYSTAIGDLEHSGRRGTALVEHAWGGQSPVDLGPIVPRTWHWDVLAFSPGRAVAALEIGRVPVPGGGGVDPEGVLRAGRGLRVRSTEWSDQDGLRVPERWEATLALRGGHIRYAASRRTAVAPVFAGGGFLGFDFEGEWRPDGGAPAPVRGTGFREYSARSA